jgi:hypothetical protein
VNDFSTNWDVPQDVSVDEPVPCRRLIGPAGTGKTFALQHLTSEHLVRVEKLKAKTVASGCTEQEAAEAARLVAKLQEHTLDIAGPVCLTATTGIAAVNLGGVTVNSMLRYADLRSLRDAYLMGRLQRVLHKIAEEHRWLVVEEYSMADAAALDIWHDAIQQANRYASLRGRPMGLLLVGDLAQLPPISQQWVFQARTWPEFAANTTRLTKVYRQDQRAFLDALNFARTGQGGPAADLLEQAGVKWMYARQHDYPGTTILPRNIMVNAHNQLMLDSLPGSVIKLDNFRWGEQRKEWDLKPARGGSPAEWGIPPVLELKIGAKVMVLANGPEFQYVNGDTGVVEEIDEYGTVHVKIQRTHEIIFIGRIVRHMDYYERPAGWAGIEVAAQDDEGEYIRKPHHRKRVDRFVTGQIKYYPLRLAYATTVHKCVDAKERIPVLGLGVIPLSEAKAGMYTPFGILKAVVPVSRPAVKVVTECGYEIVCSDDHSWMTEKGLIPTSQLRGARIELARPVSIGGTQDAYVDSGFWWMLGLLVGDGNYSHPGWQIHFSTTDQELGDGYQKVIQFHGSRATWRRDKRGLHTTDKPFRQRLHAMGLDFVKAPDKRIPRSVWEGGSMALAAFLRGLFDADGHVGRSNVVYCTVSDGLAKDVHEALLSFGIISLRQKFSNKKGTTPNYWQIRICAEMLSRFASYIGFSKLDRKNKLARLKPNRWIRHFDGYDTVVSVEGLGAHIPMVDVELPDPHLMNFGVFFGHNSQGLTLDDCQIDFRDWFFKQPAMLYVALSRCRTLEGLRLIGQKDKFIAQCQMAKEVLPWI